MFRYAVKRVSHSAKLFAALLIATTLGTSFFAGAMVASNIVTRGSATQALNNVVVDFYITAPITSSTGLYSTSNSYPHSSDLVALNKSVSGVQSITATEIISYLYPQVVGNLSTSQFIVAGVQNNSLVMQGIPTPKNAQPLGPNETYVCTSSPNLNALSFKGSIITLNFTWLDQFGKRTSSTYWNLTVEGVVSLSDRSLSIAENQLYYNYGITSTPAVGLGGYVYRPNVLIVSWNKTASKIMDFYSQKNTSGNYSTSYISNYVIASIDRDKLESSYDIGGQVQAVGKINAQLSNVVLGSNVSSSYYYYSSLVQSPIYSALSYYEGQLLLLQLSMIVVALPIFFVAWYVGTTASGISFNLRRREIGLLSVRGFTKRNILRLFVTEAIIIGVISGLVGFLIGVLIIPLVFSSAIPAGVEGLEYALSTAGIETAIIAVAIGVLLSVLTIYRSASRASSMKTIDALKEYSYVEQTKKPVSKWTWAAFILGTYKMVAWIIGLNLTSLISTLYTNIALLILLEIALLIDFGLNLFGPILFLYGAVKLIAQRSSRLQRKIGSIGRSAFGESGLLATKNVQRNPARNFAVAFIIALIVGYGVIVIAGSASSYDYQYRLTYYNVGADVSTYPMSGSNMTVLSSQIANITGVSAVTLQGSVPAYYSGGSMTVKVIDPANWLNVAYYEDSWFRGVSAQQAFQSMTKDNYTIILDSGVADYLSLGINDTTEIGFNTVSGEQMHSFRVVGFFGPAPVQTSTSILLPYFSSSYGSFIPAGALSEMNLTSIDYQLLIKLNANANATFVVQSINNNVQNVTSTQSASMQLQSISSNFLATGSQDVENVGIVLVIVSAALEILVIVGVTFLERKKELAVLSVRGMSSGQLSKILLVETLSIVVFALTLGLVVGFIDVVGTISSTFVSGQLVTERLVLPLNSFLLIVGMVALVTLAAVIPAVVAARRATVNARRKGGW